MKNVYMILALAAILASGLRFHYWLTILNGEQAFLVGIACIAHLGAFVGCAIIFSGYCKEK